jgi:hypothetical protein
MKRVIKPLSAGIFTMTLIAGCGGGGGGSTPTQAAAAVVVTSFPLQAAYKTRVANGSTRNANVSGTCSGSATTSDSAPSAATFEGASALSVTSTATLTFTNCTPASSAGTSVGYYDSNYNPLGHSMASVEYGKFLTVPSPLPTSVKVGDTAVFGTETIYSDSTKTTITGQRVLSFVIEADGTSTSTAVANLIVKQYNASNQLLYTEQGRYRIAADASLTYLTSDLQYSTTSTNHFILTAK